MRIITGVNLAALRGQGADPNTQELKDAINKAFTEYQSQPGGPGARLKIYQLLPEETYLRASDEGFDIRLKVQLACREHEYQTVYGTLNTKTGQVSFGDTGQVFRKCESGQGWSVLPGQIW